MNNTFQIIQCGCFANSHFHFENCPSILIEQLVNQQIEKNDPLALQLLDAYNRAEEERLRAYEEWMNNINRGDKE